MFKLYFGSIASIISTLLIIVFVIFFGMIMYRRSTIVHWGILVLIVFFLGLFMSMMSGFKDGMGTSLSLIPTNHWIMITLSILGGLAFIVGIVTVFVRRQDYWQASYYILSSIIIAKILLTEVFRVVDYIKNLS